MDFEVCAVKPRGTCCNTSSPLYLLCDLEQTTSTSLLSSSAQEQLKEEKSCRLQLGLALRGHYHVLFGGRWYTWSSGSRQGRAAVGQLAGMGHWSWSTSLLALPPPAQYTAGMPPPYSDSRTQYVLVRMGKTDAILQKPLTQEWDDRKGSSWFKR